MSKNTTKIIIGVVAGLLLLLILAGIGFYQYVYIPSQVVDNVNLNLEVVRSSNKKTLDTLNSLADKLERTPATPANYKNYVDSIKQEQQKLNEISSTADSNQQKIQDGLNDDTKNFANSSRNMIKAEQELVQKLNGQMENTVCIVDKLSQINDIADKSTQALRGNATTTEQSLKILRSAADSTSNLSKGIQDIKTCFNGEFSSLLTPGLKADIDTDSQKLDSFQKNILDLVSAVEKNNAAGANKAAASLKDFATFNPKIFSNPDLSRAITSPTEKLQQSILEYRQKTDEFRKAYDSIKTKYKLEEVKI
ncbi:MAG: hypothetical protein OHK0017_09030 [Patescibacteria group bacterium]